MYMRGAQRVVITRPVHTFRPSVLFDVFFQRFSSAMLDWGRHSNRNAPDVREGVE